MTKRYQAQATEKLTKIRAKNTVQAATYLGNSITHLD